MPTERYLRVVDNVGNTVFVADGDSQGAKDRDGAIFHAEESVSWPLLASSVDTYIWSPRVGTWVVVGATSQISVSGGTGANVQVRVCTPATAVASGTAQLTTALDLEETAPNRQVGAMVAAPGVIAPGDQVALDFSGTLTGLVGQITVYLKRIS